jgi:hypothetical protein
MLLHVSDTGIQQEWKCSYDVTLRLILIFRRVRKIAKSDYYLSRLRLSVSLSVHPQELNSDPTEHFPETSYLGFFSKTFQENSSFIKI